MEVRYILKTMFTMIFLAFIISTMLVIVGKLAEEANALNGLMLEEIRLLDTETESGDVVKEVEEKTSTDQNITNININVRHVNGDINIVNNEVVCSTRNEQDITINIGSESDGE